MDKRETEALINAVRNKPAIWYKENTYHRSKHVVDACWKDISKELMADEAKLRKRWKYLREQFTSEHAKMQAIANGNTGIQKTTWPFYMSLMFLKDVVRPVAIRSRDLRKALRYNGAPTIGPNELTAIYESENSLADTVRSFSPEYQTVHGSDPARQTPAPTSGDRVKSAVFNRDKNLNDPLSLAQIHMNNYLASTSASTNSKHVHSDDEHLHFFKSMLPHIRRIPERSQLIFRNRVLALVDEYAYQNPNGPYETTPQFTAHSPQLQHPSQQLPFKEMNASQL